MHLSDYEYGLRTVGNLVDTVMRFISGDLNIALHMGEFVENVGNRITLLKFAEVQKEEQ